MPDHIGAFLSPMPALLSAAEATRSLRVGTNVLNNDFRHPLLLAREAATLDLLTDGRLELGLGGWARKLPALLSDRRVWRSRSLWRLPRRGNS